MIPVSALLPAELADTLEVSPGFRGKQIFSWIHARLVFDFSAMSNLPAGLRRDLSERALAIGLQEEKRLKDPDGTVKFRFLLRDGAAVESVVLRDRKGRITACLSTQVGCAMGCSFCRTGSLGYTRDLTAHEIVDQFLLLRSYARKTGRAMGPGAGSASELSSVVFMGMGEPLANLDNVQRAVDVLSAGGFSSRRITLSTCGLVEGIHSLSRRQMGVRLAVSLISADGPVRSRLIPISRSNPLPELRRALVDYQNTLGKRITLEIVLMAGINDRPEDIEALVGFVHGGEGQPSLKALVNLIPWNPVPEFPFERPETGRIEWFQRRIEQAGIPVTRRISRGSAVCGSCGQLGITPPPE